MRASVIGIAPALRGGATAVLFLAALLLASGCIGRSQPPARTAQAGTAQARADDLKARTPDEISGPPALAPAPLHPVPVPLDSAVAGTKPVRR